MDIDQLRTRAESARKRFHRIQRLWSGVHHGSLFLSILCSVAAGLMLQLQPPEATLSALLTSAAAVLTTLAVSGGFERKWRAARLARGRVDGLLLDLERTDSTIDDRLADLRSIILQHDVDVVAEAADPTRQDPANSPT